MDYIPLVSYEMRYGDIKLKKKKHIYTEWFIGVEVNLLV